MGNYCIVADFYPSPFPMSKTLTLVGVVLTHIRGCRRSSQTNTITYTMTDTIRNIITDTLTDTCKRLNEVGKNTSFGWVQGGYVRSEVNITCALMPLD